MDYARRHSAIENLLKTLEPAFPDRFDRIRNYASALVAGIYYKQVSSTTPDPAQTTTRPPGAPVLLADKRPADWSPEFEYYFGPEVTRDLIGVTQEAVSAFEYNHVDQVLGAVTHQICTCDCGRPYAHSLLEAHLYYFDFRVGCRGGVGCVSTPGEQANIFTEVTCLKEQKSGKSSWDPIVRNSCKTTSSATRRVWGGKTSSVSSLALMLFLALGRYYRESR